jgi:hypothetical protein
MTEQHFEELVNLYLDNEIGPLELGELKRAIRVNVLLRRKFERACELHQAARKALASRAQGGAGAAASNGEGKGTASPVPITSTARATARPRSSAAAASREISIKDKQALTHRNASVSVLAERQMHKGAASEVDLSKVSLESSREARAGGRARVFGFFDSPLGMCIGLFLLLLGAAGLYFGLKLVVPTSDDDTNELLIHRSDVRIDPKVLRELGVKATDGSADAGPRMPVARLDPEAQSSMPAMSSTPVKQSPLGEGVKSANTPGALPTPASMVPLPAPEAKNSVSTGLASGNLPPATLMGLPGASGLAPGQDYWVKMSMPTMVPAPPAPPPSSDGTQPVNQTSLPMLVP